MVCDCVTTFLGYLILIIITFLGLFVGLILGKIAEEELEPGKKYLNLFKIILFLAISYLLFYLYDIIIFGLIFLLIMILSIFLLRNKDVEKWQYTILAGVFFLSSFDKEIFVIIGSLIFLFGFPAGSFFYMKMNAEKIKKNKAKSKKSLCFLMKELFFNYYFYPVLCLIFYALKALFF